MEIKYIVYFIVITLWYVSIFFAMDSGHWKVLTIVGYIIALIIYFLYYMPIDKAYTKAFKEHLLFNL